MNNKYFFLLFLTVKSIYSQTFFTVPQNVWKFSVTEKHGNEKWKGHDGNRMAFQLYLEWNKI